MCCGVSYCYIANRYTYWLLLGANFSLSLVYVEVLGKLKCFNISQGRTLNLVLSLSHIRHLKGVLAVSLLTPGMASTENPC